MKLLTFKQQQKIYVRIVEVIKTLVSVQTPSDKDDKKLNYAIGDMWEIAQLVGDQKMIEALEVKSDKGNKNNRPRL